MPWPPGHGEWRSWGWALAGVGVIPQKLAPTVTIPSKVSILRGPVTVPHPPEGQGPQVLLPQGVFPILAVRPKAVFTGGCFRPWTNRASRGSRGRASGKALQAPPDLRQTWRGGVWGAGGKKKKAVCQG